ncbi:MAG: prolipoprotein diacylglyceryl transferase [Alphaproteobacteria bacterium CG_4_10_14_0_8_um_filter_53_9]|nr:MAG: prolipoprotein diacylglyceryl transferase [Alphaproteobacteria bacterium CG_4_10_14_0_8_um_filter_53_9]
MFIHPQFNPVAVQLGPVAVHWYGLAYLVALLGGLWGIKKLIKAYPAKGLDLKAVDDFFTLVVLGVIVGGRLGYVLFYGWAHLLEDPLWALRVWEGGMSFHGGLAGVIVAVLWFSRKRGIHPADIADRLALVAPLGLFLGRVANFVNGELWGRPAEASLPWATVFPQVDNLPRHPSQLYEAGLEGVLLAVILWSVLRVEGIKRWRLSGLFCLGYALARTFVEDYRTPEITHNIAGMLVTQGQMLSIPLALFGAWALWKSTQK